MEAILSAYTYAYVAAGQRHFLVRYKYVIIDAYSHSLTDNNNQQCGDSSWLYTGRAYHCKQSAWTR